MTYVFLKIETVDVRKNDLPVPIKDKKTNESFFWRSTKMRNKAVQHIHIYIQCNPAIAHPLLT